MTYVSGLKKTTLNRKVKLNCKFWSLINKKKIKLDRKRMWKSIIFNQYKTLNGGYRKIGQLENLRSPS